MSLETESSQQQTDSPVGSQPGQGGAPSSRVVKIKINGTSHQIPYGRHSVAKLKELGGVPPADELDQVIDGQLVHLPNDGHVDIKGEEMFVSHPVSGCAS